MGWRKDKRRQELQRRWGFLCTCYRCSALGDDTRRFSGCKTPGCTGEILLEDSSERTPVLRCKSCAKALGPETTAALLRLEAIAAKNLEKASDDDLEEEDQGQQLMKCFKFAAKHGKHTIAFELAHQFDFPDPFPALLRLEAIAAKNLEKASDDDLEEEDQGQQLMKCFKFAAKHPKHTIAFELAHQFDFPDPFPAQKVVIGGLLTVLGDMASEVLVEMYRGQSQELASRGEREAAAQHLRRAAELTCILDGTDSPTDVIRQWEEKEKKKRKAPKQGLPAPKFDKTPDLDLGLDPPPRKAVEASVQATQTVSAAANTESVAAAAHAESLLSEASPPSSRQKASLDQDNPADLGSPSFSTPCAIVGAGVLVLGIASLALKLRRRSA